MELPPQPTRTFVLAGVLVAVLAGAAAWFFVSGDGGGESEAAPEPVAWAPEVESMVAFVESERGRPFVRPVAIDLVDADELAARVGVGPDGLSPDDVVHLQRSVDLLRAFGLVVDRRDDEAIIDRVGSEVLVGGRTVRYLPAEHRIVVRADGLDALDAVGEVELVGALGEALHDQHFSLSRASRLDRSTEVVGSRAVSAGVGPVLIERYLEELPQQARSAWAAHVERSRDDDAAAVLAGFVTLPEDLGEALVHLAVADTATRGSDPTWVLVDELLSSPPRTELELLQPWAAIDGFERVAVSAPTPDEGTEVLAEGGFGASSLYLVLALRVDPRQALAASLQWAGDAFVLTRHQDGRRCVAVSVEGRDGDASDRYQEVMEDWVASGARRAEASVSRHGRTVTLRSCDPGSGASAGTGVDPGTAVDVAVNRTLLLGDLRVEGLSRNSAVCTADRVLAALPVEALMVTEAAPEAQILFADLLDRSRRACRNL